MKKIIAIIGDSKCNRDEACFAYEIGKALVEKGYRIVTGGMGGIMEASMRGGKMASNHSDGDVLAIIPGFDKGVCQNADIVIPSGLDIYRNGLVVSTADAVICLGGKSGTLNEISTAWSLKKMVIAVTTFGGWSKEVAGRRIDDRYRVDCDNDCIFPAQSIDDIITLLDQHLNMYNKVHKKIPV